MAVNNSDKMQDQIVDTHVEPGKIPDLNQQYQFETPTRVKGHRRARRVIHRTRDIEHVMVHGHWKKVDNAALAVSGSMEISPGSASSSDCFRRRLESKLKMSECGTPSTPSWHVGVDGPWPQSPLSNVVAAVATRAPPTFTPSPPPKPSSMVVMGKTWKRFIKKSQSKTMTKTMHSHQRKVSNQGIVTSLQDLTVLKKAIDFSVEQKC